MRTVTTNSRVRFAARWLGLAAVVVGCAFAFDAWFMPPRAPAFSNPSVWQALIDSRWVIGAIRLVVMIAAVYLVASIWVRVRQGQWLAKVGPAEVGQLRSGGCGRP
jgi:hypothetical protein